MLAVHVGGARYILDNMSNAVASDELFRTRVPVAAFVGDKTFVHGFTQKTTAVGMGKFGYRSIRLGDS